MKKIITAFDIHYPFHNKKCIDILFDIIRDFQPDIFIFGGDFLDMESISYFSNNKPKKLVDNTLNKDYQGFQGENLKPLNSS